MLPRHFVPFADQKSIPLLDLSEIVQVGPVFRVGGTDLALCVRGADELLCLPLEERGRLFFKLQSRLVEHALSLAHTVAELLSTRVFVFRIEVLEQRAEVPGLFDPIQLTGTLTGPFPQPGEVCAVRGELTLSRADLLFGFLQRAPAPFVQEHGTSYAAFLPADAPHQLCEPGAVVVAMPVLPSDVGSDNEYLVRELLHDTLVLLRDDARRHMPESEAAKIALPVPNRAALETALQKDGFSIEGDLATRKETGGFFNFGRRKIVLAKEGTVLDYLAIAQAVLASIGGFDRPSSKAMASLVRWSPPQRSSRVPTAPTPPRPSVQKQAGTLRQAGENWMKDFAHAPVASENDPTVVRRTPLGLPRGTPEWMKDFE